MIRQLSLFLFFFAAFSFHCSAPQKLDKKNQQSAISNSKSESIPQSTIENPNAQHWIESTLQQMTLEEKVGQLFVVFTTSHYMPDDSKRWQELLRYTKEKKVGGFYFSLGGVYEFPIHANRLQRISKIPLMISVDFEWGAGMRISEATTFPRAMALGATRDTNLAYKMGLAIAKEARALGVHQNYSPVVDVNNNPKNPVINTRSFSEDPKLVSAMARAFIRGTQDGNVIATVKHFPGHGGTDSDTHLVLPTINSSRARLDSVELLPFKNAIDAGVHSVMISHIHAAAFDPSENIPATASQNIVTNLLQQEFGFKGLIVTDALAMQAIAKLFSPGETAVRSFLAGADVLLMSPDTDTAIDSVVYAVKSGKIPEERLNHSVRKILRYKHMLGLDTNRFVDIQNVSAIINSSEHKMLAQEIARKSVTVLGNQNNILPLHNVNGKKIVDIVFSDNEDPDEAKELHNALLKRRRIELVRIDPRSNDMEYDDALKKATSADLLICQFDFQMRSGAMSGSLPENMSKLMSKIVGLKKSIVAISTGNPYVAMDFPLVDAYVATFSPSDVSKEAAAEILFGEVAPQGKLPITIPSRYAFGDGVTYPQSVLRYGKPQEAGFNPDSLKKIDAIVENAIADSAFPGAVLLVAKDGVIVHEKAYGRITYEANAPKITTESMFDLASVTKVIATTSAVMRLVDEKKISLNDPIVKYFPAFAQNGKEKITIYNLMVHNSGLPAWRKFYEFCDSPKCVIDSIFATPLVYATGDSMIYSDLGLITMGKLIEKVTKTTLNNYVDSVFFKPLGMNNIMYNPPPQFMERIVPTEVDSFWKKTNVALRGRVHDENAATLGGVSGHAGLFSTASDLVILLQMELNGGTYGGVRFIKEETIKQFTARQSEKSSRGIGWDTKTSDGSFSGKYTSEKTFLHTGFTGTSVVVDPEKKIIVVFLTNRVYPTRANSKLFRVRPAVHNAVYGAMK